MDTFSISRTAKGKRPAFFPDEPAADQLLGMVMTLAGEVAVLRERLDTVECLAAGGKAISAESIEAYEASLADRERREAWRQQFLDRLFQGLAKESADDKADAC